MFKSIATFVSAVAVSSLFVSPALAAGSVNARPPAPAPAPVAAVAVTAPVRSAPILSASGYENRMPCVRESFVPCARVVVLRLTTVDARCWVKPRARVVSVVDGVVTVNVSGRFVRLSSRMCVSPSRAVVSVKVPAPVTAVVDFGTGEVVDLAMALAY